MAQNKTDKSLTAINPFRFSFFGTKISYPTSVSISARNQVMKGMSDEDIIAVKRGISSAQHERRENLQFSAKGTVFSLFMAFESLMWDLRPRKAALVGMALFSIICAKPFANAFECKKTIKYGEKWLEDREAPMEPTRPDVPGNPFNPRA